MEDFTTIISKALSEGNDITTIVDSFTKAVNQAKEKQKEEEYISKLSKKFFDKYAYIMNGGDMELADAASLATLVIAKKNPKWDSEKLQRYERLVNEALKDAERFLNVEIGFNRERDIIHEFLKRI